MQIRFLRDYRVKDHLKTAYAEGDEITASEATARHFINRGAAEEVIVEKPRGKRKKPTEKAAEPTPEQASMIEALADAPDA